MIYAINSKRKTYKYSRWRMSSCIPMQCNLPETYTHKKIN